MFGTEKDVVFTPKKLVEDIYKLINIKQFQKIWLPFDDDNSEFKNVAIEQKLNFVATHDDFFEIKPPINCYLAISNPPFSLQNGILEKMFNDYDLGIIKSFVLLLPLSTLETQKRSEIYSKHVDDLSVVILKKRIKFQNFNNSFNKAMCLICVNIPNLNKGLNWF